MKNYKRIIIVVIVALLASSALAIPARAAPVKITLWTISTEGDASHKAFTDAIAEFNKKHQDVQIEATYVENQAFKTQIQVAISAGNPPDVFQTWGGGVLQSYVKAGVVREIKALSGDNSKTFLPAALGPGTFDGKHYAVPADLAAVFLWYNKDLFKQYNIEAPKTWTQFLAACKTFKDNGIIPAAVGNKEKWPGMFWMDYLVDRVAGPQFFPKAAYDQANGGTFNDPAYAQAGAKIQEAAKAGCFEEGVNGGMDTDARLLLATGKSAMQVMGTWNLNALRTIDKDYTNNSLDVVLFPAVEGGKGDQADLVGGTGQAMAISAKAPKRPTLP